MKQLTREQAIEFGQAGVWRTWTPEQRGVFQLFQEMICIPPETLKEDIEAALGRPIQTFELGSMGLDALRDEWVRKALAKETATG